MFNEIPILPDQVVRKPLHFFFLVDTSGSMAGKKIATLNQGVRETIPALKKAMGGYPQVEVLMRAIKFSNEADWHAGPQPVPVETFFWQELSAYGGTATAKAIRLLASEFKDHKMPRSGCPPVCVLVSDGFCTDTPTDYDAAIQELLSLPWGKKSVRLAIAIGDESGYDEQQLLKFVSHKEIGVLKAHAPEQLVSCINWATITPTIGSSIGKSRGNADLTNNVVLPAPPQQPNLASSTEVF